MSLEIIERLASSSVSISKNSQLEKLSINNNQIRDVDVLKHLPLIDELDLSFNQIENIDSLKSLKRLKNLELSFNKIKSIDSLRELIYMKELLLSSNCLTDVDSLQNLTRIEWLLFFSLYFFLIKNNIILNVAHDFQLIQLVNKCHLPLIIF